MTWQMSKTKDCNLTTDRQFQGWGEAELSEAFSLFSLWQIKDLESILSTKIAFSTFEL